MVNELNALESKVAQVVSLCRALRVENAQLKAQLASGELERRNLGERIERARGRIEQLADKLPQAAVTVRL